MKQDNNQYAYPFEAPDGTVYAGMALRDYFATHCPYERAMHIWNNEVCHSYEEACFIYADRMLAERTKAV